MDKEKTGTEPEKEVIINPHNVNIVRLVWILLSLNILLVIKLNFDLTLQIIILYVLFVVAGLMIISFMAESRPNKRSALPPQVSETLQESLQKIRPLVEDTLKQEMEPVVVNTVATASHDFMEGLEWLWQNGQDLYSHTMPVLNQIKEMLETMIASFYQEDIQNLLWSIDRRLGFLKENMQDMDKVRAKQESDLEAISARLLREAENSMALEVEKVLESMESVLLDQIYEVYENTGEILEPRIESVVGQVHMIVKKRLEDRLSRLDTLISRQFEDTAAKIIGEVQHLVMTQLNGINHLLEVSERLITEKRSNSKLVEDIEKFKGYLLPLKEETSNVLMNLAWQDILIEKRWQELDQLVASLQERISTSLEGGIMQAIEKAVDSEIPGFTVLQQHQDTFNAARKLVLAEVMYRAYEKDKLTSMIEDRTLILFQFARALDDLSSKVICVSQEEIKRYRQTKDGVKTGAYDGYFAGICDGLKIRSSYLLDYLADVYPRQYLQFCQTPYLPLRPVNAGQAGWFLFASLITGEPLLQLETETMNLLIAYLLIAHQLRNTFIHPSKNRRYVKMDSPAYLDDMRTVCTKAFSLLSLNYEIDYNEYNRPATELE